MTDTNLDRRPVSSTLRSLLIASTSAYVVGLCTAETTSEVCTFSNGKAYAKFASLTCEASTQSPDVHTMCWKGSVDAFW